MRAWFVGEGVRDDGSCVRYDREARRCSIYDSRPAICRVDEYAETNGLPLDDWYEVNAAACNRLQDDLGIDPSFRVRLPVLRSAAAQ